MQYNRHFHDLFTWLKLCPKHLFRNCLHLRLTVWTHSPKIMILIESPLTHWDTSRSGITSANVKIIIADVDSTLSVGTLLVDGQHCTIYFSMFATASSFTFLVSHSLSGLVLDVQFLGAFSVRFLIDFSSIISFFCVSLGPWCFLLRPATSHPSQLARVRIFLRSHGLSRRMQLCGPCLIDHGRLDAFTATFTVPRVSAR